MDGQDDMHKAFGVTGAKVTTGGMAFASKANGRRFVDDAFPPPRILYTLRAVACTAEQAYTGRIAS